MCQCLKYLCKRKSLKEMREEKQWQISWGVIACNLRVLDCILPLAPQGRNKKMEFNIKWTVTLKDISLAQWDSLSFMPNFGMYFYAEQGPCIWSICVLFCSRVWWEKLQGLKGLWYIWPHTFFILEKSQTCTLKRHSARFTLSYTLSTRMGEMHNLLS